MSTLPSFAAFHEAAYGHAPFPWQARLAATVLDTGWPTQLDLPTGSGKTRALDVALYALAARPETMPRRIVLVVDRRMVVDQAARDAAALRRKLVDASEGPLRSVADALRAVQGDAAPGASPFEVAVMRGGMPRDNDWAARPDVPLIGLSTVDQVGSRLLFRGYGVSSRSAPIHAGLLGNDTLLLLDEVHLANAFAETLRALTGRYQGAEFELARRFVVVEMSATVREEGAAPFRLADDDRAHPVLQRRLSASKRARLVVSSSGTQKTRHASLANDMVAEAKGLLAAGGDAKTIGILVNRVETALKVYHAATTALGATHDVVLLTGRMRPIDRDAVVERDVLPRARNGRSRLTEGRGLVLVATQCVEAGADLDLDGIVTECASLDALRQRFGRVDRSGALGASDSVIVARAEDVKEGADDPVYGGALRATWAWLQSVATDGAVDFGIGALPQAVDAEGMAVPGLVASAVHAAVLLPETLDALAQTSPQPQHDPDVALWLHGPSRAPFDVQIVWRDEVPLDVPDVAGAPDADAGSDVDVAVPVRDALSARRPSALEAVSISIAAARRWLAAQGDSSAGAVDMADAGSGRAENDDAPRRGSGDAKPRVAVYRWRGDDSAFVDDLATLRPGDTLVVSPRAGGLTAGTFDAGATAAVVDLGTVAGWLSRGEVVLRCTEAALAVTGAGAPAPPEFEGDEAPPAVRRAWIGAVRAWADAGAPSDASTSVGQQFLASMRAWGEWYRGAQLALLPGADGEEVATLTFRLPPPRGDGAVATESLTEDDDSAFTADRVTLKAHLADVRAWTERFAAALRLPPEVAADLSLAAAWHDLGKADPRFQRWLAGGDAVAAAAHAEPLAKAVRAGSRTEREAARRAAGYPRGYRHELLSVALVESAPSLLDRASDRDLVLHLVAAHHGWCRPFAPLVDAGESLSVSVHHDGMTLQADARHTFAALDSGVADRFWRLIERYGWWGLAWLEAIVRLADHRASAAASRVGDVPAEQEASA